MARQLLIRSVQYPSRLFNYTISPAGWPLHLHYE